MRIVWGEQAVRWFKNASEFTGYNKKLAEILLDHIPCRGSLCDVGCGAGLIDMELAPYIGEITCVDINADAVSSVGQTIKELGIENISTICMDATKLEGQWDTVMGLFYGGDNFFTKFFHMAKDRLILVTHGSIKGEFGPEGHQVIKCFDVNGVSAYLDSLGVKYHLEEHSLEYGQPFSDPDDARAFVKAYSTPMSDAELDEYLSDALVHTGDANFPYYLPKQKKLGIFVIRRDENENIQRGS